MISSLTALWQKNSMLLWGKVYTFQSSGRSLRLQVCGIAKAASGTSIPNFYVSGLFAETSPLFTGKDFSLKVWLKQEFLSGGLEKSSALLARIGEECGISDSQTSPNYYSIDTNPLTPSVILVYFFLDLLVMVIGLLVIYSIFYISIMSRIQAFGQMQTLGMTAGQIRRMVNLESSMLCLLGSTTGILPGLLLAGAVTGPMESALYGRHWTDRVFLFLYFPHGFSPKAGKSRFQDYTLEGSDLAGKL